MTMLFSPWFWLAFLIWSGICASGGASAMSRWDDAAVEREHAELAEQRVAGAQAAMTNARNTDRRIEELERKLSLANLPQRNKPSAFIPPSVDTQLPVGFVRLWNDTGGTNGAGGNTAAAAAPGDADARPSGVALTAAGESVNAAKDALELCRRQVKSWQDFWPIVVQWYEDLLKGLAK